MQWPSLRRVIAFLAVLTALVVVGWMYFIGRTVPFAEQKDIYGILRNVSGTMFGVLGLWIGLLYPGLRNKVFSRTKNDSANAGEHPLKSDEDQQADHILQPFFMSLFVLLITFTAGILAPIVKRAEWIQPHTEIVRGLSYSLIGLMAILQVVTIWRAMRITDKLKSTISRGKAEKKVRLRIRQNKDS